MFVLLENVHNACENEVILANDHKKVDDESWDLNSSFAPAKSFVFIF